MTAYVPNPGFAEEWQASTEAVEVALAIAEAGADVARDIAPKREEHFANSIEAAAGVVEGQAIGRVLAKDFKSAWIEFGTRRSDPGGRAQPTLRPAMEAVTGAPVVGGRS